MPAPASLARSRSSIGGLRRIAMGLAFVVLALARPAAAVVMAGPIVNPANGHEYFLLQAASWADAEAEAITLGGHLVTIDDAAENDWVWETFQPSGGPFWIGLNDVIQEGVHVWVNGTPTSYTNWWVGGGEPNDAGGVEDAVEIKNYLWNDRDGAVLLAGVVEVAPIVPRWVRVDWSATASGAHGSGVLSGSFGDFEVASLGQVLPLPAGTALTATASGFAGNFANGVYPLDQSAGGLSIRFDAVEPAVSTTLVGDAEATHPARYGWTAPCGGSNQCRVVLTRYVAAGVDSVEAAGGVLEGGPYTEYYSSGTPQYTYTVPEPGSGAALLAVAVLVACRVTRTSRFFASRTRSARASAQVMHSG